MELAKQAFETLFQQIVAQPAAAKMCFVDVYAAGPEGVALVDRTIDAFEALFKQMLDQMPGYEEMPSEIVRALIGGVQKVIHKRLLRGQEEELLELAPQLWDWLFLYPHASRRAEAPSAASRAKPRPSRSARLPRFPRSGSSGRWPQSSLRRATTRPPWKTSSSGRGRRRGPSTSHFDTKEDAMVAALDSGSQRMLAEAMPAFRRAHDWQHAIQATQEAMFTFGVQEPEYARLGAVEIFGAGTRALEQREKVTEGMEALLADGLKCEPERAADNRRGDRRCALRALL